MAPTHTIAARLTGSLLPRLSGVLLGFLSVLSPAFAQPAALTPGMVASQPVKTLADCVRTGLQRQPSLAAARASVAAAETQRQALDRMCLASLVSRELPFRRQQSSLSVSMVQAGLKQTEQETVYAVTRNFFSVIYARQQESLVRGLVQRLKATRETAQMLLKKGDPDALVTQVDVDKLSATIDLYQLRLVEAESGVGRARAALREAMGLTSHDPMMLAEDSLPSLGQELHCTELIEVALARRGELVQASTAVQIFELEIAAQGTSLMPTMRTFASGADLHSRQVPQGVSNHEYRPGAIDVEMPTQLVGKRADRMERAAELKVRAVAVLDKTRNLIVLETEDAFLKWQDAYRRVKILEKSVPNALAVAKSVRARFDNNKASGEDLLRAETLLDQVQAQLNEALYQHALAVAALERITAGGLLPSYRQ